MNITLITETLFPQELGCSCNDDLLVSILFLFSGVTSRFIESSGGTPSVVNEWPLTRKPCIRKIRVSLHNGVSGPDPARTMKIMPQQGHNKIYLHLSSQPHFRSSKEPVPAPD
jgi:hypothetical protein